MPIQIPTDLIAIGFKQTHQETVNAHTDTHTRTHNPHTCNLEQSVSSDGRQAYLCTMHSPHLCHKFNFELLSFRSFVFWNLLWCQFSKFTHIASWRRVRVACFNGIEMIFTPFELITCHIHKQVHCTYTCKSVNISLPICLSLLLSMWISFSLAKSEDRTSFLFLVSCDFISQWRVCCASWSENRRKLLKVQNTKLETIVNWQQLAKMAINSWRLKTDKTISFRANESDEISIVSSI